MHTHRQAQWYTRVYTPHLPYPTHITPHHTAHNSQKRFTLQIKSFSRLTSAVCCYCFAYEFPEVQSPYQRRCNLVSYIQDDKMNRIGKNRIFLTEGLVNTEKILSHGITISFTSRKDGLTRMNIYGIVILYNYNYIDLEF